MSKRIGKDRIQKLISKVLDKYESDTGEKIIRNQVLQYYDGVASKLTELSNQLPQLDPITFKPDSFGRYTIGNAQLRDAYFGKVDSLKDHFYEACHLYLYNKLSKDCPPEQETIAAEPQPIKEGYTKIIFAKQYKALVLTSATLFIALVISVFYGFNTKRNNDLLIQERESIRNTFEAIKNDMKITPYKPTQKEIDALVGFWEAYTGSPQARSWDPDRYHMVVPNIIEVKYKGGYFTFNRYGPDFDQVGYMQFEAPGLVSIHSYFIDASGNVLVPKLSLLQLKSNTDSFNVTSASWNFDRAKNVIIGIREVFVKLGKGGSLEIVTNSLEKFGVTGKILQWNQGNNEVKKFYLKNQFLDTLPRSIRKLIDEESMIFNNPHENTLLRKARFRKPSPF